MRGSADSMSITTVTGVPELFFHNPKNVLDDIRDESKRIRFKNNGKWKMEFSKLSYSVSHTLPLTRRIQHSDIPLRPTRACLFFRWIGVQRVCTSYISERKLTKSGVQVFVFFFFFFFEDGFPR